MLIRDLKVETFRLFSQAKVDFQPGLNFIVGKNGAGKTSLLEALYLLMAGRSFRSSNSTELLKIGEAGFKVEASFEKWGIPQGLKWIQGEKRSIWHNSSEIKTLAALPGIVYGVLLIPQDVEIVKGSPSFRRHYLDFQIAQVDPLYIHHLIRYGHAMKQRNVLLRQKKVKTLELFEEGMARSAGYIIRQRELAAVELNRLIGLYYQEISGKSDLFSLRMSSSFSGFGFEEIMEKFKKNRLREMDLGSTIQGIHRDDFSLEIGGLSAKNFASEGEVRSLAAALKLAEWKRIFQLTSLQPLLLVDDIGLSLDPGRLQGLYSIFSQLGQVIVTSANGHSPFSNSGNYPIINPEIF